MSDNPSIVVGLADEFTDALTQAMINVELVMDDIDNADDAADSLMLKVKNLIVTNEAALRKIVTAGRRTISLIRGIAIVTGHTFAEIYAIGIEVALLTAELLIDVATAESLTVVGAIGAAAKLGTIIALLTKVNQLRAGDIEAAARTEGAITALTALSYNIVPSPLLMLMVIYHIQRLFI